MAHSIYAFLFITIMLLPLSTDRLPVEAKSIPQGEWTDLTGRIVWQGDPVPKAKAIPAHKHGVKNGPATSEEWVINPENRGVQWVYVWLEPDATNGPDKLPIHPSLREVKPDTITLEQSGCRFVPHAVSLREGQKLVVNNKDAVPHNFRWVGDPRVNPGG